MFSEKLIAERLDQIGDDRSCGGTVKKDNLIHSGRAAEPCLIDIGQPFSRRAIYQRFSEFDVGPLFDCRFPAPTIVPPDRPLSILASIADGVCWGLRGVVQSLDDPLRCADQQPA